MVIYKNRFWGLVLFFIFIVSILPSYAQDKGHLLIIGGGERPGYVLKKFIELAGKENAKILIIPVASGEPDESGNILKKEFIENGCKNVDYIIVNKQNVDLQSNIEKLKGVTGIFFGGGDQSKLTDIFFKTDFLKKIKQIYTDGGVIGGTSAGTAVMSKIMITGNELINKDPEEIYIFIKKNNIETKEGFGFINNAIIDQHFVKRKRHNRLISIVLENPELPGIGIDEETAIIVNPDNTFEVIGENSVIVYDASSVKSIKLDKNGNLGADNIKLQILVQGDKYNLSSHQVFR